MAHCAGVLKRLWRHKSTEIDGVEGAGIHTPSWPRPLDYLDWTTLLKKFWQLWIQKFIFALVHFGPFAEILAFSEICSLRNPVRKPKQMVLIKRKKAILNEKPISQEEDNLELLKTTSKSAPKSMEIWHFWRPKSSLQIDGLLAIMVDKKKPLKQLQNRWKFDFFGSQKISKLASMSPYVDENVFWQPKLVFKMNVKRSKSGQVQHRSHSAPCQARNPWNFNVFGSQNNLTNNLKMMEIWRFWY